jgi:putative endonuclease
MSFESLGSAGVFGKRFTWAEAGRAQPSLYRFASNSVRGVSWVVYVLRCRSGELYTGSTNHLERRLKEHSSGKGAKFTRSRLPVKLVYKEEVGSRRMALRREITIKAMRRKEKLLLVGHAALATTE